MTKKKGKYFLLLFSWGNSISLYGSHLHNYQVALRIRYKKPPHIKVAADFSKYYILKMLTEE